MNPNKIAKSITKSVITAAGFYPSIPDDILKYCEEEMKKHASKLDYYLSGVWSQDGRSYDGYISFTEGDAHCDMIITGYDLYEIKGCEEKAKEMEESCKSCFVFDKGELFDEREIEGYGKLEDLDNKARVKLLNDEVNCPDDIQGAYGEYDSEWFSDEYGFLCVEVQFHANKDVWNVNVYNYIADQNMMNKTYIYSDGFEFKDGEDPKAELASQIAKAFQAL